MMLATRPTQEDQIYWLALALIPGLGPRRANLLLNRFRTPQAIFRASRTELEGAGLSGALAQSVASGCSFDDAVTQEEKMRENQAVLVPRGDPAYPEPLRDIYDPPIVLFCRGRVELLKTICIAVVGTRRPTPYGLAATERLSGDLAKGGATVVSGMARGIDTVAHQAALASGGNTVAVLGCGADIVYPAENRRLAAELAAKALIVSEFPMGSTAFPQNFPIRNRVISGLSAGTVIVEGGQYSGSAITAKLAMDQGREVFAVPGNITSQMSWGPNLLIKQGAKLVQSAQDILEELPEEVRRKLRERNPEAPAAEQTLLPLGPQEALHRKLLEKLNVDIPVQLDSLLEIIEDHSASELIAGLFELEMLGLVRQLAGKNFVKVW